MQEVEAEKAYLIVFECEHCHGHLGIDFSFLERVGSVDASCPYCKIKYHIDEVE